MQIGDFMGKAVGIDLGTTYTAVAYVDEYGKATILKNGEGQNTTPSAVYIDPPHYIVGDVAVQSTLTEPERVVQFIKRFMGLPDYRVQVEDRAYSPEFISSIILRKVVQEASATLGETIESAVITVPAYFSEAQRQATFEAGQLAGINVLRIINEPTAAALAYGIAQRVSMAAQPVNPALASREITYRGQKITLGGAAANRLGTSAGPREITYRGRKVIVGGSTSSTASQPAASRVVSDKKILVYDLGGGTFDVTILRISTQSLDVIAIGGESHLGGKDWDDAIMNFIEDQFLVKYGVPLNPDASLEAELRLKAEAAKRQLTGRPSVPITFKARVAMPTPDGDSESVIPVRVELSRQQFEAITGDLLRRTQLCLESVISQAGLTWDDMDEVLCVGGSSRMPMVREMVMNLTGRQPLLHDPDECVAKGAALQAALILQDDAVTSVAVNHVLPHSLGVATIREDQTVIERIVPGLTPLPCHNAREEFTTTMDNQTTVQVHIYEGEARDPSAYPSGPIGVFYLDTTPPRPKGQPKIRVEFRCDENGRIMALARDQDTGKESRAFVTLGSGRTNEEMLEEQNWLSEAVIA
jgi:molecular chaperone DnaK